jgi:hypothetical protein
MPRRATLVPDAPTGVGTVHMVLDDFGPKIGRAWREMDEQKTDERDIVRDIVEGEYTRPIQVVAFNLDERWVRDVTEDIARAVIEAAYAEGRRLGPIAIDFIERATGTDAPADLVETS